MHVAFCHFSVHRKTSMTKTQETCNSNLHDEIFYFFFSYDPSEIDDELHGNYIIALLKLYALSHARSIEGPYPLFRKYEIRDSIDKSFQLIVFRSTHGIDKWLYNQSSLSRNILT